MRLPKFLRRRHRTGARVADIERMRLLLAPVDAQSRPNIEALHVAVRNVDILALNVKALGYELGRRLADALPHDAPTVARRVDLACKPSTQADIESDWVRHWCRALGVPVIYHRKMWELAYVLQALHDGGHIAAGRRGLGFGCGMEPVPSYLAAQGAFVTMTDLPPDDRRTLGWSQTGQHTATLDHARASHLVDRETFRRQVSLRYVDMNAIPADLAGYDFCWSICAMEHLGSIAKGLDFVEAALRTLKPGGLAVHTLEYNLDPDGPTIDNWPTVIFQRRHIEALVERLTAQGHTVAPLDFDAGDGPMDRFIDVPPWSAEGKGRLVGALGQPCHLKVSVDGFAATCFGLIIRKAG